MITDKQVRLLMKYRQKEESLKAASAKAGMDEKTARKYIEAGTLPSQMKKEHTWSTRKDDFAEVWEEIKEKLKNNPGLEAKTLFEWLQKENPSRFSDGQLRTLQRRIKVWRALEGPDKEAFFPQTHNPGERCQSDFTHVKGITINGTPFPHLIYHFVLTYSNWETGTVCFSESFESLSEGLQNALWELGGVPESHQTDRLTSAVQKIGKEDGEEFTASYRRLLRHYGVQGKAIQAGKPNENGDVEQRNNRLKKALEQSLFLRGSVDFANRKEYEDYLRNLFRQLNSGRAARFREEQAVFHRLPSRRRDDGKRLEIKVGPSSTISVVKNTYSVPSRLIGETVVVRVYAQKIELWYGQRCVESLPRLRGEGRHRIEYRHIIGWLVRKPGAFANYRYRADLFPSSHFRMAYDALKEQSPLRADKEYLKILDLAASEGETRVEQILKEFLQREEALQAELVEQCLKEQSGEIPACPEIAISSVDLNRYDHLISGEVREWLH